MNKMQLIRLIPLLLVLAISALLSTGLFNRHITRGTMVNKVVPPFTLGLVNDATFKMTEQSWKGQVAVINIFASWCRPCQAEHATLMKLAQLGKVNLYGIAWRDRPQDTLRFLNAMGNPYQMVANDQLGRTTVPFSISGVPETLVVGRDGKVYYHYISALTEEEVSRNILPLVERLNAESPAPNAPAR